VHWDRGTDLVGILCIIFAPNDKRYKKLNNNLLKLMVGT
jgi:hypothetical protein